MNQAFSETDLRHSAHERSGLRSLRVRALGFSLLLVAGAVGVSSFLLATITERQLASELRLYAAQSGNALSNTLRRPVERHEEHAIVAEVMTALADPRLSFVTITMHDDGAVIERVRERQVFSAHHARKTNAGGAMLLNEAIPIRNRGATIGYAYRTIIASDRYDSRPLAYLTLGFSDPTYRVMRNQLSQSAIIAASLVALGVIPAVILFVRRLTRPIQAVSAAATELAGGHRPEELEEKGATELRALSRSFNEMAGKLSRAREALMRTNAELESKVEERTRALQRVNDLLKLEISDKNDFLRTVSHDLGAPLRNIAGMTSSIIRKHEEDLPDEIVSRLERIDANVRIETEMIDELLELSRIGMRKEKPEVMNSFDLVRDVARAFDHDLKARRIELTIDENLPILHMEPGRLRNVVQNLIDNAIKYMGESPVRRIHVSCRRREDNVAFTIEDTGPGIPEKEQAHVFQVFRRGADAGDHAQGKGVGLAAVRATVERWSGKLSLTSELGKGSRFTFTIPADRVRSFPDVAGASA